MPKAPTIEDVLDHARVLLKRGDLPGASRLIEPLVEKRPDHTEILYLAAVTRRYRGVLDRALTALNRLLSVAPGYGRAYQERGHVFRARSEHRQAIREYQRAVAANPALRASWEGLAATYRLEGDRHAAEQARLQAHRLADMPAELVSVASFMHEGKLYKAERLCRSFVQKQPKNTEAMRLLAAIGVRLQVLDDAEFLLESALAFEPDFLLARLDYIAVLQKRQKFDIALEQAEIARRDHPDNTAVSFAYANACAAAGHFEAAIDSLDAQVALAPDNPALHMARGHTLKTIGRHDKAVQAYRSATRIRPEFGDARWSLANLKTYRFDDDEIDEMQHIESDEDLTAADRYHLCFALGKALEDRGDFVSSFRYYERGNSLKKQESGYDADRMAAEFERQRTICNEWLAEWEGRGNPAPDPIFIVGLPRAGSTLIEQILASHSQIDGTMELPCILATVSRLEGRRRKGDPHRYPAILRELDDTQLQQLGARYLDESRFLRQGAPHFTDKMPNNFRHLGLIRLILPNARIIDARRDAMACCFSGYKQLFAEGQAFTYSQTDIGRYYRDYVELMDHWDDVLPDRILRVQHEVLVADLEGEVRRMLDFLRLPFETECLAFHRNERPVRTASSEQVRQPITTRGLDTWRNFDEFLAPMKHALGPELAESEHQSG